MWSRIRRKSKSMIKIKIKIKRKIRIGVGIGRKIRIGIGPFLDIRGNFSPHKMGVFLISGPSAIGVGGSGAALLSYLLGRAGWDSTGFGLYQSLFSLLKKPLAGSFDKNSIKLTSQSVMKVSSIQGEQRNWFY